MHNIITKLLALQFSPAAIKPFQIKWLHTMPTFPTRKRNEKAVRLFKERNCMTEQQQQERYQTKVDGCKGNAKLCQAGK